MLFRSVLLAVAAGKHYLGQNALYVVSFLSGLTDMDAITLSISQLVRAGESTPEAGWRIIMVAAMSNLVFKTGTVAMLGSRALLGRIALSFGATIAVGVVLLLFV